MLRGVASNQLRDAGVGQVTAVARLRDARMALERQHFDVVLCSREVEGEAESGQDLLDELRRERLLPHSTVFLMVTRQAAYHQVVEAGEAALDGLLLWPYTGALLQQRLQEARHRKRELAQLLKALDAGARERAFALALQRFQQGAPYAQWCGRLAAELLLDLQRPQDAQRLFEKLYTARPQPWARLGQARALAAGGDLGQARRLLEQLLAQEPGLADAHDLHGRLLLEQGDFEAALAAYRSAAERTPGCLLRAQHAGALAFYQGHKDEARRWLERCLRLGVQSRLFDALSLLLLALLHFDDAGTAARAERIAPLRQHLQRYQQRHPESLRLQRLLAAADALLALAAAQPDAASAAAHAHARLAEQGLQVLADDFDFEAANIWLALWARLPAPWRSDPVHAQTLQTLGRRFCGARATTEALCGAAERQQPALDVIHATHAEVQALAEQAMSLSLRQQAEQAAAQLLQAGLQTRNPKLLELATALVRRQAEPSAALQTVQQRATEALQRGCRASTHIAGIERAGRSAPGLRLRPPPALAA